MRKNQTSALSSAVLASGLFCLGLFETRSSVIITIQQSGSDVVATATGSVDTTDLVNSGGASFRAALYPSFLLGSRGGSIAVGPTTSTLTTAYVGITGPTSLGSGAQTFANSGSGPIFVLLGGPGNGTAYLPNGYVSGTSFSSSATWNGATLTSLGVTPGTYNYTWGSGGHADSATITATVPEPEEYAVAVGVFCLGVAAWTRRSRTA